MSSEQSNELPIRNSFEYLGADTQEVRGHLSALNSLYGLLASKFFYTMFGEQIIARNRELKEILETEVAPDLHVRTKESLSTLNSRYAWLKDQRAPMKWTTVDAVADSLGNPLFFNQNGGGLPMPTGVVEGQFNGFEILDVPQIDKRLYIRNERDGQIYWGQATLKNFE